MTFTGNWLHDTFNNPLAVRRARGQLPGLRQHARRSRPGATKSRAALHRARPARDHRDLRRRAAEGRDDGGDARGHAGPDRPERRPGRARSTTSRSPPTAPAARHGPARSRCPRRRAPVTTSGYDVVEKTIGQMRADMESGLTTSQAITRAYLDRIKVYDQGQFGFNAYEIVADDAMEQARKADEARAAGKRSPVLGIPIAVKNLFDTYDMATTNGSLTFEGFRPEEGRLPGREAARGGRGDHRQGRARGVRDLRQLLQRPVGPGLERVPCRPSRRSRPPAARPPRWRPTWPRGALGSQTGDSLYAPASGASLVTLRGTDGLESGTRRSCRCPG